MPANRIKYRGTEYNYSESNDNVLTYVRQPEHHYYDWTEDGGILIVKFEPNYDETHQYYVLHEFRISEGSGYITQENLHEYNQNGGNRYAEIID